MKASVAVSGELPPSLQAKLLQGGRPGLLLVLVLSIALLAALLLSVQFGAVPVKLQDWLTLLDFSNDQTLTGSSYVLWNIRLPRALFAVLVGAALGMSGALTQGLFRNPLADPNLLGITAGAAAAAGLSIVVLSGMHLPIPMSWRMWILPVTAFSGALLVCFALDRVARWISPGSIVGLLLTGIALNALGAAVLGLCTYLATDEQLRNLSFWTLGSLAGASWLAAGLLLALLLPAWWWIRRMISAMNALALGEAAAAHVGIDVRRLRTQVIVLVAVLTGFAVAWCGMIGFISLVAPHLVRTMGGPDQRQVIPRSMLMGGLLLLLADTVARCIAIPAEVPVGIFTALLGSPFFLILLRNARGRLA
jgi:iron complex transport system permease protein